MYAIKVVGEGDIKMYEEEGFERQLRHGFCNVGNRNTGYGNHGDDNVGGQNLGNRNTGYRNIGNHNTGSFNIGDSNSGNHNVGKLNSGEHNFGDRNAGNENLGDCNTGSYNYTSHSVGYFSTTELKIPMFNKPTDWTYRDWLNSPARRLLYQIPREIVTWVEAKDMTDAEKFLHPAYEVTGGYLRLSDVSDCGQIWWDGLSEADKEIITSLPNFNPVIFEYCTGIVVSSKSVDTQLRGLFMARGIRTYRARIRRELEMLPPKRYIGKPGTLNLGYGNTGAYNTGNYNASDCNTGDCNVGVYNTGNCNVWDSNTSSYNIGGVNTEDRNLGVLNTGYGNLGSHNTGNFNIGDYNTGDYNISDYNIGCFMTEEQKIYLFNKPSYWTPQVWRLTEVKMLLEGMPSGGTAWVSLWEMTDEEKSRNPYCATFEGYLKAVNVIESRQQWWCKLSDEQKALILSLPNFDVEIFRKCTGIRAYKNLLYFKGENS